MKWFTNKLFPDISPNSLIVIDNTSYRSDPVLIKSWTKQRMQDWLQTKETEIITNVLKAKLYSIIQIVS